MARQEGVGGLNFCSRRIAVFYDDNVEVGLQFATQAAIVLANAQASRDARQRGEDLARGVLSVRASIDASLFSLPARTSQRRLGTIEQAPQQGYRR